MERQASTWEVCLYERDIALLEQFDKTSTVTTSDGVTHREG